MISMETLLIKPDISKEELVALELTRIWTGNKGHNALLTRHDIINGYEYFVEKLKEDMKNGNV